MRPDKLLLVVALALVGAARWSGDKGSWAVEPKTIRFDERGDLQSESTGEHAGPRVEEYGAPAMKVVGGAEESTPAPTQQMMIPGIAGVAEGLRSLGENAASEFYADLRGLGPRRDRFLLQMVQTLDAAAAKGSLSPESRSLAAEMRGTLEALIARRSPLPGETLGPLLLRWSELLGEMLALARVQSGAAGDIDRLEATPQALGELQALLGRLRASE